MLAAFRAFAKTWVAKILLGVLALAFVGWGASSTNIMHQVSTDVVSAGSHKVSADTYKRIYTNYLQRLSQQQGAEVTAQQFAQAGADESLLRQLGADSSLSELIERLGIRPSLAQMFKYLSAQAPQIIDPVTHRLSDRSYKAFLQQIEVRSPADRKVFEAQLTDQVAGLQFTSGINAGLVLPRTYGAVIASPITQERDVAYFGLSLSSVPPVAPPTEAQIADAYKELGPRFQTPELRAISVVRISLAAITPTLPVSPADVQKAYDERKASFGASEKRAFVQVNLRSAADAPALTARLARGEDPAAAAKSLGIPAITFPDTERAAIPDPAVAQAVFAMPAGQTSPPIKGQFGSSIVRVTHIAPPTLKPLAQVRADIEQQLRQEAARQKVTELVGKYNSALETGADLTKAAQAAGLPVYAVGPISAQGVDQTGRPNPSLTQPMLKDAFTKPAGGQTDLVDMGASEYYALRVDRIAPASTRPLTEVRPLVTQFWLQRETVKRLQARADALVARLKAGESIDAVAGSAGQKALRITGISQLGAQKFAALGGKLLEGLFGQKPKGVFTAPAPDGQTLFIAQLTAIREGDLSATAGLGQWVTRQVTPAIVAETHQFIQSAATQRIKPKIDRNLGLDAVGVDRKSVAPPSTLAASGAAGGAAHRPLAQ